MHQLSLFTDTLKETTRPELIYKDQLNSAQLAAVQHKEGPALVIAGAGSGKTRTLVYRTGVLVEEGVPPEKILLLTFTRKAAQEMIQRAGILVSEACHSIVGGTFHAIGSHLLRRYASYIGYGPNFTIIDQADAEGIINLLKASLNFSGLGKRFPSKRLINTVFSRSVNKGLPLETVLEDHYQHIAEFTEEIQTIHKHYHAFKRDHSLMDYDDLLVYWQRILRENPVVHEELSHRFQYIMVDEYQDTNHIQADIVRRMATAHNNVMVVGDDSQSIYSFRGADFKNIMEFPSLYKGTKIIRLEENYRSTQPILRLTNTIIEQAAEKYTKKLYSQKKEGEKPILYGARNESAQARFIAQEMRKSLDEGAEPGSIAVLFRSGYHSYKLELELANQQIPFEKRGGMKLTESAHIKDVLSYLRIVTNAADHLSWNRVLLLLPKVGPKTAQRILATVKDESRLLETLQNYPASPSWRADYQGLLERIQNLLGEHAPPETVFDSIMAYYQPIFERVYHDDFPSRARDLEQLRAILSGYTDLQAFIDDAALDPPEQNMNQFGQRGPEDTVILSTVHSAKGLEWDTIFIMNLVEGKFPSGLARLPEELEEERRLLYVAATRAKKRLFLVYPREIVNQQHRYTEPACISGFLESLPRDLTASVKSRHSFHFSDLEDTTSSFESRQEILKREFEVGDRVRHNFFGEGEIDQKIGPRTVSIFFPRHGRKTIHLDYAKLEAL